MTAGIVLGLACAVANGSTWTSTLGQMVTPWVLVAAWAGWRAAPGPRGGLRRAGAMGALALVSAVVAYYVVGVVQYGVSSPRFWILWGGLALVVGIVAGGVGRVARTGAATWWGLGAALLLGATGIAESLALWTHIDHPDAHATYVAVSLGSLALAPWLVRAETARRRVGIVLATLVVGAVFALPLEWLLDILGVIGLPRPILP